MTATFFEYLGWVQLSPNLKESFNKTLQDAEQHRHGVVEIEHLLFALVDDPEGAIALTQMGIDRDVLREDIAEYLEEIPAGAKTGVKDLQPGRMLKKLMAKASDLADKEEDDSLDGGDVIRALGKFEASNNLDFLAPLQKSKAVNTKPTRRTTRRTRQRPKPEMTATKAGENTVEYTNNTENSDKLNFDADPIRASIKSILARRRDAEEILYECEWYHLFKSLNMIDEVLEGEAQTHRAKLLARAEAELAERPRCRKAFMYVRHLDQELARLQGIVDFDWAGEVSPDEAVTELARLRALPKEEKIDLSKLAGKMDLGNHNEISKQLFDVKVQESEVLALEQKLHRLDKTAGSGQERLKDLEGHLETHDTHSKKRENVIGELERYLRSEMQLSDDRDQRIDLLEKELHASKNLSSNQVDKASTLEQELAAFKEHAGNREKYISELKAKLKSEVESAGSHKDQVQELHDMLTKEKSRAENHDKLVADLQKTYLEEQGRVAVHEQQVQTLETDLKTNLAQLQIRETDIKTLQENLTAKENDVRAREEKLIRLEADLSQHQNNGSQHKQELQVLQTSHKDEVKGHLQVRETESRAHQQEVNALRAQLLSLETKLQGQENTYSVERVELSNSIDRTRQEIEDSENLIEIIRATGEPYRVNSEAGVYAGSHAKPVSRRTIPVALKPR